MWKFSCHLPQLVIHGSLHSLKAGHMGDTAWLTRQSLGPLHCVFSTQSSQRFWSTQFLVARHLWISLQKNLSTFLKRPHCPDQKKINDWLSTPLLTFSSVLCCFTDLLCQLWCVGAFSNLFVCCCFFSGWVGWVGGGSLPNYQSIYS